MVGSAKRPGQNPTRPTCSALALTLLDMVIGAGPVAESFP